MNKQRRKELESLKDRLEEIRSSIEEMCSQMEEVKEEIEAVKDEEEEAYDNLPESLQEGERGERMQTAIEFMESAVGGVEDIYDTVMSALGDFDSVAENIEEATGC